MPPRLVLDSWVIICWDFIAVDDKYGSCNACSLVLIFTLLCHDDLHADYWLGLN